MSRPAHPTAGADAAERRVIRRLELPEGVSPTAITGPCDSFLRIIEGRFSARVHVDPERIELDSPVSCADSLQALFSDMVSRAAKGEYPDDDYLARSLDVLRDGAYVPRELREDILLTCKGRPVRPKTPGQKRYVDAIRSHTITFGLGPAGTGKTYLAMAVALASLRRGEVGRIILTRPIVEAGENLGFLPGTLEEKVDPYVRPLYDALLHLAGPDETRNLMDRGLIEIVPLAFMRGRTLDEAFVILDEAQNSTCEQMKMFLTRLGFSSRFVITGDATQTDLPTSRSSLGDVRQILRGIDDIAFVDLVATDIVRHSLVGAIVEAYGSYESRSAKPDHQA